MQCKKSHSVESTFYLILIPDWPVFKIPLPFSQLIFTHFISFSQKKESVSWSVENRSNLFLNVMTYQVHHRSTTWVVLESVALVTLDIVIFFGNFIICLVIYRSKRLRTMTNMLVVALSISDLITASITLPMAAGTSIRSRWIYGSIGCQIFGFCSKYLVHVSLYIITLIALNRYIRIIKPSLYKKVFTIKKSLALLAFIWVMPALVRAIPILTSSARFVFVSKTATCILAFYEKKSQIPYTLFATIVFIALPMLVIIVCYAAVTRHVRKHRQRISSVRGREQGDLRVSIEEVKVTRTLFALVFTFVLCWLPVSVALLFVKAATGSIPSLAARVLSCLVALSSASTPFVYGLLNRPFRKEFKKVIAPLCCRDSRTFDSESAWNLGLNARDSGKNRQGPGNQSSSCTDNKQSSWTVFWRLNISDTINYTEVYLLLLS